MADKYGGKKSAGSKKEETAEESQGKRPGKSSLCPVSKQCGGCQYLDMPYKEQLKLKQQQMQKLLGSFGKVYPIVGMENPFHYRNKVHAVFGWR